MMSDTKTGLILGLVFIFVIAYLVNGPFSLPGKRPGIQPDVTLSDDEANAALGLAARERQAHEELTREYPAQTLKAPEVSPSPEIDRSPRRTVYHVVQDNENLAHIAKQYYGEEAGNRRATIDRLFKANSSTLKSPDHIRVGQKLIIPLDDHEMAKLSDHGTQNGALNTPVAPPRMPQETPVHDSGYTVQDGDSLWKIAVSVLGNGNRYLDIIKANRDLLANEDSLTPGMRLILPDP
jgi:nucleoid-associated protein YgaU